MAPRCKKALLIALVSVLIPGVSCAGTAITAEHFLADCGPLIAILNYNFVATPEQLDAELTAYADQDGAPGNFPRNWEDLSMFFPSEGLTRECVEVKGEDDKQERCFYAYYPPSASSAKDQVPLVVDMHGLTECAPTHMLTSGWRELADRDGFAVVWPQGKPQYPKDAENSLNCWGAGTCCQGCASGSLLEEGQADLDVKFLESVVDKAVDQSSSVLPDIDERRIYMAGFSNGCEMAQLFASARNDMVAAVCCNSGYYQGFDKMPGASDTYVPTPIHLVHGDLDGISPWAGGVDPTNPNGEPSVSAIGNVARWAQANGCSAKYTKKNNDKYQTFTYSGCKDDAMVRLIQLYGVGHFSFQPTDFVSSVVTHTGSPSDFLPSPQVNVSEMSKEFCFQFTLPEEEEEEEEGALSAEETSSGALILRLFNPSILLLITSFYIL